jgi:hypothetical protein
MTLPSFLSQVMAPGGGIHLVPFTRAVILCLCVTTTTVFLMGVARIHMFILSCLGIGMYYALGQFQKEYSAFIMKDMGNTSKQPPKERPSRSTASKVQTSKRED